MNRILTISIVIFGVIFGIAICEAKSISYSVYPQVELMDISEFRIPNNEWIPINTHQKNFCKQSQSIIKEGDLWSMPEIEGVIGESKRVELFLRFRGVQFKPVKKQGIVALGIINVKPKWFYITGKTTTLKSNGKEYLAFKMLVDPYESIVKNRSNPLISICCEWVNPRTVEARSDQVWMMMTDRVIKSVDDLKNEVKYLEDEKNSKVYDCDYTYAVLPKVSLNQSFDISWLNGIKIADQSGKSFQITQALEYLKFQMDDKGQTPIKGLEGTGYRGKYLTFDRPFILWVERADCRYPIYMAYLEPDSWKEIKRK